MTLSIKTNNILTQIAAKDINLGKLRTIAKSIKKDHQLALELWEANHRFARHLAILIMDTKLLNEEAIDRLIADLERHNDDEKLQLIDWLMANQLTKNKKLIALMESWKNSSSSLKRRIFWYYQGRLRWMGKIQTNSEELLPIIEKQIEHEEPEVQWAMNFTAGWIGVYEKKYRNRCITLGEKTGLYKEKKVSKGCTPEYLPAFIRIESNKRENKS